MAQNNSELLWCVSALICHFNLSGGTQSCIGTARWVAVTHGHQFCQINKWRQVQGFATQKRPFVGILTFSAACSMSVAQQRAQLRPSDARVLKSPTGSNCETLVLKRQVPSWVIRTLIRRRFSTSCQWQRLLEIKWAHQILDSACSESETACSKNDVDIMSTAQSLSLANFVIWKHALQVSIVTAYSPFTHTSHGISGHPWASLQASKQKYLSGPGSRTCCLWQWSKTWLHRSAF